MKSDAMAGQFVAGNYAFQLSTVRKRPTFSPEETQKPLACVHTRLFLHQKFDSKNDDFSQSIAIPCVYDILDISAAVLSFRTLYCDGRRE